jgi:hypothetical protein
VCLEYSEKKKHLDKNIFHFVDGTSDGRILGCEWYGVEGKVRSNFSDLYTASMYGLHYTVRSESCCALIKGVVSDVIPWRRLNVFGNCICMI